jgi:hypothetical protein
MGQEAIAAVAGAFYVNGLISILRYQISAYSISIPIFPRVSGTNWP